MEGEIRSQTAEGKERAAGGKSGYNVREWRGVMK